MCQLVYVIIYLEIKVTFKNWESAVLNEISLMDVTSQGEGLKDE